jgi:hypothetical protein
MRSPLNAAGKRRWPHRVKRERGRYVYAEGVLLAVSRVVASRFQSIGT